MHVLWWSHFALNFFPQKCCELAMRVHHRHVIIIAKIRMDMQYFWSLAGRDSAPQSHMYYMEVTVISQKLHAPYTSVGFMWIWLTVTMCHVRGLKSGVCQWQNCSECIALAPSKSGRSGFILGPRSITCSCLDLIWVCECWLVVRKLGSLCNMHPYGSPALWGGIDTKHC